MLYRIEKLIGMSISAIDGEIGKVRDIYFDDHHWAARYLVVQTGTWLDDRRVLISPFTVARIDWDSRILHLTLTMERIKASPSIDTDKAVSRQHEIELSGYYDYPDYWSGPLLWGGTLYPLIPTGGIAEVNQAAAPGQAPSPPDPHLRSIKEVSGYHLEATDAAIGHIEDFLIDNESWAIRYLVVNTRNWLPGKHVVIPPQWIERLEWQQQRVYVGVLRTTVQHAPEYDPALEFSRDGEAGLYRHYERSGYW